MATLNSQTDAGKIYRGDTPKLRQAPLNSASSSFVQDEGGDSDPMGDAELVEEFREPSPSAEVLPKPTRPRLPLLTSALLLLAYSTSLFVSFNVLRIGACLEEDIRSLAQLGSVDCFNQTDFNESAARQCAAAYRSSQVPSSDVTGPTGAQGEGSLHESVLYFEKWPAWLASVVVLAFTLVLVRVVHSQARHIAALSTELNSVREQLQTALEEEEEEDEEEESQLDKSTQLEFDAANSHLTESQRINSWGLISESGDGGNFLPGVEAGSGSFLSQSSALLSILKHDIRAPLKGSMGVLQLLLGSSLDPMQQDYVHTVQSCTRNVINIINNTMDIWNIAQQRQLAQRQMAAASLAGTPQSPFTQPLPELPISLKPAGPLFSGGLGPNPLKVDSAVFELRSVVDEVLAMYGSEACEKGLEIASLVLDTVPSAVTGDPLRLRQVLINLLAVATRLTERGHVFLCVRLAPDEGELPSLSKRVIDLGGAPPRPHLSQRQEQQQRMQGYQPSGARGPPGLVVAEANGEHPLHAMNGHDAGEDQVSEAGDTPEESHAARAGKGQGQIAKGESLTLSGIPAVDGSNSWQSICGMLREQEERFRRLMRKAEAAGKTATGEGGRVRVVFTLEDTGVGIPEQVLKRMDRPLEALPAEFQSRYSGVPLTMFLARRLVEAMGGQFLLHSQTGVGTTVTFDVALSLATKIPGGLIGRVHHLGTGPIGDELHPELAGTRAKLRGLRCLVVDGRPVRQQITATYMARLGLKVDLSDSAPAAALALRHARNIPGKGAVNKKSRWDIVVVDADSDGPGTGLELGRMVQQLKDLAEPWEKAPLLPRLVLLAQTTNEELEAEAGRQGFSCIMLKPLRATSMATALLQALGLNPSETTAMALRRRQILLRLCLKGKKALVVDHVFMTRKAAAVELSKYAEVCLAVESARDALGRLRDQTEGDEFSLILVNMHTADMPGADFVERVLESEEEEYSQERKRQGPIGRERAFSALVAFFLDSSGCRADFVERVRELEEEEYSRERKRKGPTARKRRTPIVGLVAESAGDAMPRWRELDMDGLLTSPIEEAQLFGCVTKIFKDQDKR